MSKTDDASAINAGDAAQVGGGAALKAGGSTRMGAASGQTASTLGQPIIRIEHLGVAYEGNVALRDVSLNVYEHDFIGIIGPNGGGKTTLVKAVLGLVRPSTGTIRFCHPDGTIAPKMNIGYLPQYSSFDFRFPITVEEVVRTGFLANRSLTAHINKEQKEIAARVMERMELYNLRKRPISNLSGGQRQRVLMARALVNRPSVLILDEPSTYIDRESEQRLYSLLEHINSECAIMLVSHNLDAVMRMVKNIAVVNTTLTYNPNN